jgi:hypothetical protein
MFMPGGMVTMGPLSITLFVWLVSSAVGVGCEPAQPAKNNAAANEMKHARDDQR